MKDVAGRRWSLEGLELARLAISQDIPVTVAGDREAEAEALSVARSLLHPIRCRLTLGLRLENRERHPPQP